MVKFGPPTDYSEVPPLGSAVNGSLVATGIKRKSEERSQPHRKLFTTDRTSDRRNPCAFASML
jgi:hypothetical protein